MTNTLKKLNDLIEKSDNEELKEVFNEYAMVVQTSEDKKLSDFERMKKRKEFKEYILNIKDNSKRLQMIRDNMELFSEVEEWSQETSLNKVKT